MDKLTRAQVAELSEAIIARGITVEGLAAAAGTTPAVVVMIMQGRLRPLPEIRRGLAEALGIDPGGIS
jgi:transcriptional regulator with XRE-family HTH domain